MGHWEPHNQIHLQNSVVVYGADIDGEFARMAGV